LFAHDPKNRWAKQTDRQKNWTVGTAIDFDGVRLMPDPFHARAVERFRHQNPVPQWISNNAKKNEIPALWRPKLNLQYQR
jgi:hypothetical protein